MKNKWLAKGVEYYPETDTILLIRCPKCGRENYALAVAKGTCVWCGFNGRELLNEKKEYNDQAQAIHQERKRQVRALQVTRTRSR